MGTPRLDTARTMGEIAKLAGLSYELTRRRLKALHKAHDNTLMFKLAGSNRWMVTVGSLRRVWPGFLEQFASPDDVESVGEECALLKKTMNGLSARMRERVEKLEARVCQLERNPCKCA